MHIIFLVISPRITVTVLAQPPVHLCIFCWNIRQHSISIFRLYFLLHFILSCCSVRGLGSCPCTRSTFLAKKIDNWLTDIWIWLNIGLDCMEKGSSEVAAGWQRIVVILVNWTLKIFAHLIWVSQIRAKYSWRDQKHGWGRIFETNFDLVGFFPQYHKIIVYTVKMWETIIVKTE